MNNEEKIRLVLETLGVDSVRQANKAMRELAASVDEVADEFEALARSVKDGVEKPLEAIVNSPILKRRRGPDDPIKALGNDLAEVGKKAGKEGEFGRKMLEASYIMDDLQYGFRGIVNNIPQFARTFGISTAAVGAFGIGAVVVNQALAMMGPLMSEAETKFKPLGERLDEFAEGMGAAKVEAEALKGEIDRMAQKSLPGMLSGLTDNVSQIRDMISAQKELKAVEKEASDAAEKRAAFQKRIDDASKDKTKGGQLEEALKDAGPDGQIGLMQRLAQDKAGKARGELIDEQLAAMEAAGNFQDSTILGFPIPFLQRGGTKAGDFIPFMKGGGRERAELRRGDARKKLQETFVGESAEVRAKAESIAGGTIESAIAGDPQALAEIEAISPEVAAKIKWDTEDEAFNQGIEARQRAISRRNERLAKGNASTAKLMKAKMSGDKDAVIMGRASAGPAGGVPVGFGADGGGMPADGEGKTEAEELAEQAEREKKEKEDARIRKAVMSGIDPVSLAAMRRAQAGTGRGAAQAMRQLESRDMEALSGMFMQNGMNRQDARKAAGENLLGGEEQFAEFAKSQGQNTKNLREGFAAAVEYMQMIEQERQKIMQLQAWQMQIMNQAAQGGVPPMRPQMNRARQ